MVKLFIDFKIKIYRAKHIYRDVNFLNQENRTFNKKIRFFLDTYKANGFLIIYKANLIWFMEPMMP